MIQPIPNLNTIPDLIRALNERFRGLNQTAAPPASGLFTTHAGRKGTDPTATPGMFLTETDRGLVYQSEQSGGALGWVFAAGMMSGAVAGLPSDLQPNDAGLPYLTTDTFELYRWSGSAWVNLTPGNLAQIAYASGQALTGAYADVTGASVTLTRAGRHLLTGNYGFTLTGATPGVLTGRIVANGSAQTGTALVTATINGASYAAGTQAIYTAAAAGEIVKLQGLVSAGTATVNANSSVSAVWIGY